MDLMNGKLRRKVRFILKQGERAEIRLRPFNRKKFREDSDRFTDIYSRTFKQHWGHAPQSKDEIFEILEPLRLALDMDMILFAEHGSETVGFTLTVPDYNEAIKKLNGNLSFLNGFAFLRMKQKIRRGRLIAIGVLPEWRGRGIAPLLVAGVFDAMIRKGYITCEYSWVLKENSSSVNVAGKFYSDACKRYDIYAKKIG
jgi:GNAT superfamily N-acetyltransferase